MQKFFGNFSRYGSFFLFLILEMICFILVVRYNQSQREIYLHSSNLFSGYVLKQYTDSKAYLSLTRRVDSLRQENARLFQLIANKGTFPQIANLDSITFTPDSAFIFTAIPAKVINNSITKNHNFLTLDVGTNKGIQPGMGVVSTNGLVGIVKRVSSRYAQVMSLLHRQTRVSAEVKRNHFFGTMSWQSQDPRLMTLEDIPKHTDLLPGDTIITSGYSSIFPEGLMIGKVESFRIEPGSNSYTVEVRLSEDLSQVQYVNVINNFRKNEIRTLEQEEVDNE